jgi:hypothetical protein
MGYTEYQVTRGFFRVVLFLSAIGVVVAFWIYVLLASAALGVLWLVGGAVLSVWRKLRKRG